MILIPQYRTARRPAAGRPLDAWTSGLISVYSTRQLLSSYTGNLLRVRRSSDSTEQDIGQSGGALDTTSLASFVGAGTGTVVTWYDQMGSTNVSSNGSPNIVVSGTLQTIAGGAHPAILLAADTAGFTGLPAIGDSTSRTVFSRFSQSGGVGVPMATSNSAHYAGCYQNGSTTTPFGLATGTQYVNGSTATRDQFYDNSLNASVVAGLPFTTDAIGWNGKGIRIFWYGGGVNPNASLVDFALFNSAMSAGDVASVSTLLGA